MERDVDEGRRTVLAAAVAAALPTGVARPWDAGSLPGATPKAGPSPGGVSAGVFPQGVASGGPTPSGAVCWTRVAPEAHTAGTPLRLTLATDPSLTDVVDAWRVPADRLPARDYTAKVDLEGELDADRPYYYQFTYDGATSPVGRCRTLPAPGASPDSVTFAVANCQDYRNGYYGAYGHIAEADVDFLLHLGDFIYEYGGESDYDGRSLSLPSGASVAMGLEDFRYLHRTYRTDRLLRAALAAHTLVPIWDDHEIVNDRYYDYESGRPYAGEGDHPRNHDAEFMTRLFADGIRAWWEYTPTRVPYDPDADSILSRITLRRRLRFGDLVDLLVTDERLFRTAPADGDHVAIGSAGEEITETMLGDRQREWFVDRLADGDATWTAWANEVLALPFTFPGGADLGDGATWDDYPAERDRLLRAAAAGDGSLVALTGDMHTALAGYIEGGGTRYGVEFMAPAVTSPNPRELLDLDDDPESRAVAREYVVEHNPHVEFFDGHHWGYATVEFTPERCRYSAYAVDKREDSADASRDLLARFETTPGEPDLNRLA